MQQEAQVTHISQRIIVIRKSQQQQPNKYRTILSSFILIAHPSLLSPAPFLESAILT